VFWGDTVPVLQPRGLLGGGHESATPSSHYQYTVIWQIQWDCCTRRQQKLDPLVMLFEEQRWHRLKRYSHLPPSMDPMYRLIISHEGGYHN
jgi:hypothetical protein